jgi:hypothetical protein
MVYAGFAGLVLLVGFLLSSFFVLERGVDLVVLRAHKRVLECLPDELGADDRNRTRRNLERFLTELRGADDRNPLTGEFLQHVSTALADDELTVAEVRELNEFLTSRASLPSDLVGRPASVAAALTATAAPAPTATPGPEGPPVTARPAER